MSPPHKPSLGFLAEAPGAGKLPESLPVAEVRRGSLLDGESLGD